MKKLLSLPPNLVGCFHDITGHSRDEWFCTNDPVGRKLGSGGGTAWLLQAAYESSQSGQSFDEWLGAERRILLHAGGQSRRLPGYAPSGKVLTPVPVFRWERGQRLSQDLLSLQLPLYERIMDIAPSGLNTMIVSGDVYIRATQPLQPIPEADVVCYGLWLDPDIAKDHGVFVSSRKSPGVLECMLQKPSIATLNELQTSHYYLTDIGVWLLSDRAVKVLMRHCMKDGEVTSYDLYGEFGCALGTKPSQTDEEVGQLTVAVLPLPGGEFYHFGTSHELLSSTLAIQNLVNDQREIMHHDRKPHPSIFVQNTELHVKWTSENRNIWVENACVGENWTLTQDNIVTGVPVNDWTLHLTPGQCVDIVPVGERGYAIRPYGFNDKFRGPLAEVEYLGRPFSEWARERGIDITKIDGAHDLQAARIFPVVEDIGEMGRILQWMLATPTGNASPTAPSPLGRAGERSLERSCERLMSADEISAEANLARLVAQRRSYRAANWQAIARNHQHSVFYQLDLGDAAREFAAGGIALPEPLADNAPLLKRVREQMFRSEVLRLTGKDGTAEEREAFALLRQGLTEGAKSERQLPRLSVYADQIVWGRSPVRIDIAGGWTDTPPFCLMEGGDVVNLAIELNGQPPLQAYVKPCPEPHIILRSIDLGAAEVVDTFEQLAAYNVVGSPFSIPKAALCLCGFLPQFCTERFATLREQLSAFGCGIEVTLLSAIPAGSGLGTSSLLASTVLGALSDFCGLGWDKSELGRRTLTLEQLLTTGGGWQDQFGGLLQGVKLLQTGRGFEQSPVVRWLPSDLYTQPEYQACHLLYYTGITRTAKTILAEIVRRMFLNDRDELALLRQMKAHAHDMFDAIQRADFDRMGRLVRKTWTQNQRLDTGTNPAAVQRLTDLVDDLCLGYKLPGAGGGGYLYMVAKDVQAAARIKQTLNDNRPNDKARFVDMTLCEKGLQVSRS